MRPPHSRSGKGSEGNNISEEADQNLKREDISAIRGDLDQGKAGIVIRIQLD
jgi:hypothetical protein